MEEKHKTFHRKKTFWAFFICFAVFFINDMYGFINWMRMQRRQHRETAA